MAAYRVELGFVRRFTVSVAVEAVDEEEAEDHAWASWGEDDISEYGEAEEEVLSVSEVSP